ncbi:unnamed protein product [Diatraea saccharalis]|uniref:Uncharacterized protein n=1 Tax=Diatraea saccharalis TaxID=40085 RepID=A0A9N9R3E3_9NEOP|nr:unnamed protein product [Diatraea saccharalis]
MRKFLLLALLLYNIVAWATRTNNYEYDDLDGNKRHSLIDDRRNWRKKALLSPSELDHKEYEARKRHDYDSTRYFEESEPKSFGVIDRHRDGEIPSYRKRYEDLEKLSGLKSSESGSHGYT